MGSSDQQFVVCRPLLSKSLLRVPLQWWRSAILSKIIESLKGISGLHTGKLLLHPLGKMLSNGFVNMVYKMVPALFARGALVVTHFLQATPRPLNATIL